MSGTLNRAHSISNRRICAEEVYVSLLQLVVRNDIFDGRIAEVPYGEYLWRCRVGRNGAQVLSEREDRPIIRDSTEISVFCVVERACGGETAPNDNVLSGLIARCRTLCQGSAG